MPLLLEQCNDDPSVRIIADKYSSFDSDLSFLLCPLTGANVQPVPVESLAERDLELDRMQKEDSFLLSGVLGE